MYLLTILLRSVVVVVVVVLFVFGTAVCGGG